MLLPRISCIHSLTRARVKSFPLYGMGFILLLPVLVPTLGTIRTGTLYMYCAEQYVPCAVADHSTYVGTFATPISGLRQSSVCTLCRYVAHASVNAHDLFARGERNKPNHKTIRETVKNWKAANSNSLFSADLIATMDDTIITSTETNEASSRTPLSKTERRRLAKHRKKQLHFEEKQSLKEKRNKPITKEEHHLKYTNAAHQKWASKIEKKWFAAVTCFHCHQKGHSSSQCPENQATNSDAAPEENICYKCSSNEHQLKVCLKYCKSKSGTKQGLPFAKCFVCNQIPHCSVLTTRKECML